MCIIKNKSIKSKRSYKEMTELTIFIASISGTIIGMVLLMAFDKLR